jgi:hypothetical protein
MSWARLLKRVFDIDIEHCPHCGGRLKIIAAIEDPAVIAEILTHLNLPARAPPRSPAQAFDLFQAALIAHSRAISSGLAPKPTIPLGLHSRKRPKRVKSFAHRSPNGSLLGRKSRIQVVFDNSPHRQ